MTDAFEILPEVDEETRRLLAEVDRLAAKPDPASEAQHSIGARLLAKAGPVVDPATVPPRTLLFLTNDPRERIEGWIKPSMAGRELGGKALWVRYFRADHSAGAVVVLHCFTTPGEMELLVFANRGVIGRALLKAVAAWAFNTASLLRLVVRIRADDERLRDLARRAGFLPEGIARGFFEDGSDASVWAMTRDRCPWLPRPRVLAPVISPQAGTVH